MPLSEHEQRIFDEIEQNLSEDPQFASAVRAYDPARVTRKKLVISGLICAVGLSVVIGSVVAAIDAWWIPLAGALVMFGGLIFGLWSQRKGARAPLTVVEAEGSKPSPGKNAKPHKTGGFTSRMEERWRNREDGGNGTL